MLVAFLHSLNMGMQVKYKYLNTNINANLNMNTNSDINTNTNTNEITNTNTKFTTGSHASPYICRSPICRALVLRSGEGKRENVI